MLYFKNVTKETFDDAISMDVNDNQKGFMEGNLLSIAECVFEKNFKTKVIYEDSSNSAVGFILYYLVKDNANDEYVFLHRFMIDKKVQGKGYGKEALLTSIKMFKQEFPDIKYVELMHYPDNIIGSSLYEKIGFIPTGEKRESEPCRIEINTKDPNRYIEIVRRKYY